MALLLAAAISGSGVGLLYGVLSLSIVLLFKARGVANFAQGNMGTFAVIAVYMLTQQGQRLGFPAGLAAGVLIAAGVGLAFYIAVIRPRSDAGVLALTTRTLALYVLLIAITSFFWGANQPFRFPSVFPEGSISIGGVYVTYQTMGNAGIFLVLSASGWIFFKYTTTGTLMQAMSEQPEIARLLGVPTRLLTALAWVVASIVSFIVATLAAPSTLLTTERMGPFLLYAFTGALIGGLTSFPGCIIGSLLVGVVSNVGNTKFDPQIATLMVFGLLVFAQAVRPHGLLGHHVEERF